MDEEAERVLLVAEKKGPKCHTAMPGEPCYKDVSWAITDGIYAHPEWYEGLTNKSNFETFQAVVYKINSTRCPLPCNYVAPKDKNTEQEGGRGHSAHRRAPKHEHTHGKGRVHRDTEKRQERASELSRKDKESEAAPV